MNDKVGGPSLDEVVTLAAAHGLAFRGAFHPEAGDGVLPLPDGATPGTVALLGFVGGRSWPAFAASPELGDGRPDPLDRWSRRVVEGLAAALGAMPLLPFGGPPWLPFQRWAMKAEAVYPSPTGMLIHPDWGLWHGYRGALAFREALALPPRDPRASPCESCAGKPCLAACPVGAFTPDGYDVAACAGHLATPAGRDCMERSCRARRACPVGAELAYGREQSAFHMRAFRAARVAR
ncbi:MAG TPA: ferredoxin [Stellaceae bacterium]|nr:ferredoxin [Stellaceae bacterium]